MVTLMRLAVSMKKEIFMSTMRSRKIVLTAIMIFGVILAGCTRSASTPPSATDAGGLSEEELNQRATMDVLATLLAQTDQPEVTEQPTDTPTATIEIPTATFTPEGPTATPPVVFNTPTSQAGQETTYLVQAGDSVYSVARTFGISPDDLIARNSLQYPYYLDIGQELIIPAGGSSPSAGSTPVSGTKQHIVQQGEWIYSIARKYGVSPDDIIALNNLPYPYTLYPGDVLNIP
jgi:LysM repeat protein